MTDSSGSTDFIPGQRWLSEAETELGLGIIQDVDYRLVTVSFPAADEERTYARENAPLARMTFEAEDRIESVIGDTLIVARVEDAGGVRIYHAHPEDEPDNIQPLPESLLSHHLDLTTASDRLFSGQLDTPAWFDARHAALEARQHAQSSAIKGLAGPRIDLIGHQLYIAHEVANRHAPRVLLADEVGLGKTIEAGLIIHQQLHTHRARRVLIVVPESLVHQWFVEMARRFNLHFSIFDRDRLAALRQPIESDADESDDDVSIDQAEENPFLSEQLVLCGSDFLGECDFNQLVEADWDLLVVDEAHHLTWSPEGASDDYLRVEQLARCAEGLLLLTATPEQLGQESHFARLRLLDPDRFHSLNAFIEEQARYKPVADLASALHDQTGWSEELKSRAAELIPDIPIEESRRDEIVRELIDRNGTGRILFRNTRRNIAGFPQRLPQPVPLPLPELYAQQHSGDDIDLLLHPERHFHDDSWCAHDPRVSWLADFLRKQRGEKVLVICAHKETAIDLEAWCGYKLGLAVSVFHEDMDLIARDRAAAFFADSVDGAQALICSEIGSEGRNFQFAHHLVLLDLPRNPDLLEQRIGRLDRIGQQQDIRIHIPYFEDHAQAVLFHWYHQGMDAFTHTNPAGVQILAHSETALLDALKAPQDGKRLNALIEQTQVITEEIRKLLESGRDRLLELGSFDADQAEKLIQLVRDADAHTPMEFMEQLFERYGVNSEFHSEGCTILRPGEHMIEPFPQLPEEGITVTDQRSIAISRDDMQFLTWEHPMVTGALDLILADDAGKACVSLLKNPKLPTGTLLVEAIYTLNCVAPKPLHAERFLPNPIIRTLINAQGKDLGATINHEALSKLCQKIDKKLARKIINSQKELLQKLLKADHELASDKAAEHIQQALQDMNAELEHEIHRLEQLQKKNPSIRDEEIAFLRQRQEQLSHYLSDSRVQLEAVRVIVVGD